MTDRTLRDQIADLIYGRDMLDADEIRVLLARHDAHTAEQPAQCCMCGKTGLSTVEGDGGPECELSDGRWTCSRECWDRATAQPAPDAVAEAALVTDEMVERATMQLLGHKEDTAPGVDWRAVRDKTINDWRKRMREVLIAALAKGHQP